MSDIGLVRISCNQGDLNEWNGLWGWRTVSVTSLVSAWNWSTQATHHCSNLSQTQRLVLLVTHLPVRLLGPSPLQCESNRIQNRFEPILINPDQSGLGHFYTSLSLLETIDFFALFITISMWWRSLTRSVRVEMMDCAQLVALFYWLQYRLVKRLQREMLQRVWEEERAKRSRTQRKCYWQYACTGFFTWIRC